MRKCVIFIYVMLPILDFPPLNLQTQLLVALYCNNIVKLVGMLKQKYAYMLYHYC